MMKACKGFCPRFSVGGDSLPWTCHREHVPSLLGREAWLEPPAPLLVALSLEADTQRLSVLAVASYGTPAALLSQMCC